MTSDKPRMTLADRSVRALMFAGGPSQNVVGAYRAYGHNPPSLWQITTGLNAPTGIGTDGLGHVYVCNNAGMNSRVRGNGKGTWTVAVYRRHETTPFLTYTQGVWSPVDVAIAADGTVFIANFSSAVTVYPKGSVNPSRTLTGPGGHAPLSVAFDAAGNTYVSYVDLSGGGVIYKYPPGQNTGTDLGIIFSGEPHGLAVDRHGNLIVAVSKAPNSGSDIEVFPPGATKPKLRITGPFQPFMLALGKNDTRLFVADYGSGNTDGGVFEYAYPSGTLITKDIQGPAAGAYGVAVDTE